MTKFTRHSYGRRLTKPIFGVHGNDQEIRFEPRGTVFKMNPLNFAALKKAISQPTAPLDLQITNAVITTGSSAEFTVGAECSPSFKFAADKDVSAFCLVPGGWSLLSFPSVGEVFLDRNIYSDLVKDARFADHWYAVNLQKSGVRVNPVLCAVEGSKKWFPDKPQFFRELRECIAALRKVLPKDSVVPFDALKASEAYNFFVKRMRARREREIAFLLEASGILKTKPKRDRRGKTSDTLFSLANKHNIQPCSFCFIATLIYLYEPSDTLAPIGPGLLKFGSRDYDRHTAYNSLMDLAALEVTASANTLIAADGYGFATADKGLALLWCASAPCAKFENDSMTIHLKVVEDVFSELPQKRMLELQQKLGEVDSPSIVNDC